MSAPNETFIAWLRATRKARGLSQQNVADALKPLGISLAQSLIAKIERGERPLRLDEAVALASLFGSTVDAALGLTAGPDENALRVTQWAVDRSVLLVKIRALIDAEIGGAS